MNNLWFHSAISSLCQLVKLFTYLSSSIFTFPVVEWLVQKYVRWYQHTFKCKLCQKFSQRKCWSDIFSTILIMTKIIMNLINFLVVISEPYQFPSDGNIMPMFSGINNVNSTLRLLDRHDYLLGWTESFIDTKYNDDGITDKLKLSVKKLPFIMYHALCKTINVCCMGWEERV